jgi:uncharacterized protein with PIN domain
METVPETRFAVDHMLIKLGKYLRILGCDAVWDTSIRTHALIKRANREKRMFLTSNTHLDAQYPMPDSLLRIVSTDPVRQLAEVIEGTGLSPTGGLFSKCIKCNVPLAPVADKQTIEGRVHPNVYARYDTFYTCPGCGTVFWKGAHVRNTCRKLGIENPAS